MELVSCALCGSQATTPVYTLPDYLLGRTDTIAQLVRCCHCSLIYQNPRPTLEEMAAYYPPEYESFDPEPQATSWLLQRAVQYGLAKRIRFVTKHKRAGGRLLDVGCASGAFLRSMRATGQWDVYGVEINDYAAQLARERFQLDVRVGTLEQAAFPDAFFDVVTLWDVLEHLHDPLASLQEARRILKPDGVLCVRVPNLGSRDARLFGHYWAGLDAPRHLFVFSPHTLEALLKVTGFRAQSWSTAIGAYSTFLLSVRFWSSDQPPSSLRAKLVRLMHHPVLRLLTAPLFYVRSRGLAGPGLVVVANKDAHGDVVPAWAS